MKLNGVYDVEPGTVIGVDFRTKNFVVADVCDIDDFLMQRQPLRFATEEESRPQAFKHEPRSVAEHRGIRRRMSVYGLIRQFHPTPVKAVEIEIPVTRPNRQVRRALNRGGVIHGIEFNRRGHYHPRDGVNK